MFNQSLDEIGSFGQKVINSGTVASVLLGSIGGWLAGVGTTPGFLIMEES